jgi:hypothetical protein
MDDLLRASPFVKIVDVLRYQEKLAHACRFPGALEPGKRPMGHIGCHIARKKTASAKIIKIMHKRGVARKTLGRRHIFDMNM